MRYNQNNIYEAITSALPPAQYIKIDSLRCDLLIAKKSKTAELLYRTLKDLELMGRIVSIGNSIKIVQ